MAPQVFQSVRHPLKMYLSSSRVCLLVGYQMNDCLSYSYVFSLPSFLVCPPFVLFFGGIQSNSLNFNWETFKCICFWVISVAKVRIRISYARFYSTNRFESFKITFLTFSNYLIKPFISSLGLSLINPIKLYLQLEFDYNCYDA